MGGTIAVTDRPEVRVAATGQSEEEDALRAGARGLNALGMRLLSRQDLTRNGLLSPLSVAVAIGMLLPGGRGATRAEIASALGFDGDGAEAGDVIGRLVASLRSHKADVQVCDAQTGRVTIEKGDAVELNLAPATVWPAPCGNLVWRTR